MLKWTIVVEVVVLLGLLVVLGVRYLTPDQTQTEQSPEITIPYRKSSEPLGNLSKPSIIIQKSARILTVLDNKLPVKTYSVTVGTNDGDKTYEGDRCTPEGEFYICTKQDKNNTKFYRSFGLSYPNIEDADRGLADGKITRREYNSIKYAIQARRRPPWKTALGGEIMIHGCKRAMSGTLGCIAMDNEDILELFEVLSIGTPVKIVP